MNYFKFNSLFFLLLLFYHNTSFAQIDLLKDFSKKTDVIFSKKNISNNEIYSGLNEALVISVKNSCNKASKAGGFLENNKIRIDFPKEIIRVKTSCNKIGLSHLVVKFEGKLNKTAEQISLYASEIILESVNDLKFTDAIAILNGPENALTKYLRDDSYNNLYNAFYPQTLRAISNTGIQKLFDNIIKKYNKIPLVKKVDFDLSNYITVKTIDGIFFLISEEEKKIRNNPKARTTELLQKIFK
ncbi:DUF4197 domain-containing protein [Flavobacteriales bacterium]|nr:DUF4197 domain-containing protein [Flavobacteriales bacterium]